MITCRRIIQHCAIALCLLLGWASPLYAGVNWVPLAKGLALAEIPVDTGSLTPASITALRISPTDFEFVLLMRSKVGDAYTPAEWAERYNLTAVINASMYLPDNSKSTGFMRDKSHVNNGFIHHSFGSFFVAQPKKKNLPAVDIIDRHEQHSRNLLPDYCVVVQNYRLFSSSKKPLWPKKAKQASIAAVGKDQAGNIVFIHCRAPMTVRIFTQKLLESPLQLEAAMYVEGGPEASLYVSTPKETRTWAGRYMGDFWNTESKQWVLPNVLGIRPIHVAR